MLFNKRIFAHYLQGEGIEIGALDQPMQVPKNAKVRYIDHLSRDDLYKHYAEKASKDLVPVDIVCSYETLSAAIPLASLDFIIANHVIEHFPNVLLALEEFYKILKVGGILHLAIPDKRVTFDCDRPVTTLQHLIEDAACFGSTEADKRDYEHFKEFAALAQPHVCGPHREYLANVDAIWRDRYSIHYHVWIPDSWPEILNFLNENGIFLSLFDYLNIYSPHERNEFVLILKKAESKQAPLQKKLPEKGPASMRISAFIRRLLLEEYVRYWVKCFLGRSPTFKPRRQCSIRH